MPTLELADLKLHYLDEGEGAPLLLLHGWPEWSAVWERVIARLKGRFRLIAPDLRNFGDSVGAETRDIAHYVSDLTALVDHLELTRFGIVGHDVGGFLMQDFVRAQPERVSGLFFFDCPHFGIGKRWTEKGQVREIWYQSFQQLPLAPALVGSSREATRLYFSYFLSHWSHHADAFSVEDVERWVDTFSKPGRLEGGFRWYQVANALRLKALESSAPERPPMIDTPACSLWGEHDPILRYEWQETLRDVFTNIELLKAENSAHFVHWEQPNLAAKEIARFFENLS